MDNFECLVFATHVLALQKEWKLQFLFLASLVKSNKYLGKVDTTDLKYEVAAIENKDHVFAARE